MKNRGILMLIATLFFSLASCGTITPHEHTFSEQWESDAIHHWHKSSCGHDVISEKQEHRFETISISSSYEMNRCSVCGYEVRNAIDNDRFLLASATFYESEKNGDSFVPVASGKLNYGYYKGEEDILYVTFDDALKRLFGEKFTSRIEEGKEVLEVEGGPSFLIDYGKDTIEAMDYGFINLFSMKYDSPLGYIDEETTTHYVDNSLSSFQKGEGVVFSLSEYGMDIVYECDSVFVPFSVVNSILFNPAYYSPVVFNGKDFYLYDFISGAASIFAGSTGFCRDIRMDSPYRGKEKSEAMAQHCRAGLLFNLDHYYGFLDERFVPFSSYLQKEEPGVYAGLASVDESVYEQAIECLMNALIGDGHTLSADAPSFYGESPYEMKGLSSFRRRTLSEVREEMRKRRAAANVSVGAVRYSGNTAILSFDGFSHEGVAFDATNIDSHADADSFALFHRCFREIADHGNIENVIFDVSCNGGGDTNALVPMLAFLTELVEIDVYNPLTKDVDHHRYAVDTNLDGIYDQRDSHKGEYDYFVLTSNYSFSCANLFTATCKESRLATIIGENSGGGACAVYYSSTPDGKPFQISGNLRGARRSNPAFHYDNGVPVDHVLDRDHFYDDAYLDSFVSAL